MASTNKLKAAQKKYRQKGIYLKLQSIRRIKAKKTVFDYYGWICNCCGETGRTFLTIDHVNNDGHKQKSKNGVRLSGMHLYLVIIKEGFPNKYQILCMNCNWSKRMNNGMCEHKLIHG